MLIHSWDILLVEDDEDDYILTRSLLSEAKGDQFKLDWASSFEAGLSASGKKRYDVFLIDYRLGEHDGLELVRQIVGTGCRAPIILMTGQGSYDLDVEAMKTGVTDYLVKGELNAPLLERTIRYSVERKQAEEALLKAQNQLELRVQERTHELGQANERLAAANDRLAAANKLLAKANDELRAEISERERAEKALRETETRFRTLAETTSSAIFIIKEFKIRYANPAVKIITGFSPEELQGVDFWKIAHPAYQKALKKNGLTGQWADQIPARYELKLLTKNKQERWVDITAGRIEYEGEAALVVTAFDITERDLAEQALRKAKGELEVKVAERTAELRQANEWLAQANQQLKTIIENAPEAIVVADKESRILLANPVAEKIYMRPIPYEKEFFSHAELQISLPDGTACDPRNLPLTRSALDGEWLTNVELAITWPDGQRRAILVNSAPILDELGAPNGAVAIFQDISQRKKDEDDIRKDAAQIEVQHLLIQYREMERLRIAQDLHDGPLQELVGITFTLSDILHMVSQTGDPGKVVHSKLQDTQERVKQQIRDIRTFCSELRPPTLVPFGLEKAIRSHAETFQARHPDLVIRLNLTPDGLLLPEKERLALFRIYQELLNNVIRHASAREIGVNFLLDGDQVTLLITDDGCGFEVPTDWVEMARRGHLGLVGVQERVEAISGYIDILSSPGCGSSIRVSIPRHTAQATALVENP